MEFASAKRLCLHLISAAFRRCRLSDDLCRLSVVLKRSSDSDPSTVRISISDTGTGTSLEEFQGLKFSQQVFDIEKWDGMLTVQTTNIGDDEIYHYHLNLRESSSARRLTRLPSNPKNGVKFSGTEVHLSIDESIDNLQAEFSHFFQKMLVLKIPNVAIELAVEDGGVPGSQYKDFFLANECDPLPFSASNVERMKSGLEDYVYKHGNRIHRKCDSCFQSWEHLKIGSGLACCTESQRSVGLRMEVVIIVSEISETSPCFRSFSAETEVLYFKDFSPSSINQPSLTALSAIDWKSYGLVLKSIADQRGFIVLEWENLPPNVHIDMAFHCYNKKNQFPSLGQKTRSDRNLIKKAAKLALDDLKENHAGALLSLHATKMCSSYAPDLARTLAGLILSSNDAEFKEECFSILGLQSQNIGGEVVENCIEKKIISVILMNDGKPHRSREAASSFLFEDDCRQESHFLDEEYDSGEQVSSFLDF